MKTTSILNNEDGVVMIAALMVLVLLTIIGIASTNISNTEIRISTHELIHQQNFYRAEGATMHLRVVVLAVASLSVSTSFAADKPGCSDHAMFNALTIIL